MMPTVVNEQAPIPPPSYWTVPRLSPMLKVFLILAEMVPLFSLLGLLNRPADLGSYPCP